MKKILEHITIKENSSVKVAIEAIDKGGIQLCCVVDDNNILQGVISDGDIRRALLQGVKLNHDISKVINKKPFTIKEHGDAVADERKMKEIGIRSAPIINDKNQLIGIKMLDKANLLFDRDNPIIIMAGGLGSRLYPLTKDLPKPMIEISGKPILEIIINKFANEGFKNIFLCVNYKSEIIKDYFKNGTNFGVNISYIEEDKRLGTAGALSLIKEKFNSPIIVTNGDILSRINFSQFVNHHIRQKAKASVAVREYSYEVPFGVIENEDGFIKNISEKPTQHFFVNAGIYILEPELIKMIPKNEFYDMPSLINKLVKENEQVASYLIREYWLDIGRNSELEKARSEYE
jgi:dTDP-glucose pyrophosphorylase